MERAISNMSKETNVRIPRLEAAIYGPWVDDHNKAGGFEICGRSRWGML